MAPLKAVQSLYQLSEATVTSCLRSAFQVLDVRHYMGYNRSLKQKLQTYFDCLPLVIQDNLTTALMDTKSENLESVAESKCAALVLQIFPIQRSQRLKVEHLFTNTEQSSAAIRSVKKILKSGHLSEVSITFYCNNDILKLIGLWCINLTALEICDTDDVNDYGIHWIIPKEEQEICSTKRCKEKVHGCPMLVKLVIHGESSQKKFAVSDKMLTQLMMSFSALKCFSCYFGKKLDLKSIPVHNATY